MDAPGSTIHSASGDARCSRRQLLKNTATLVLSAGGIVVLAGCQSAPPVTASLGESVESPRLRVVQTPSMCQSPLYVAQDLLRSEGFTDLQYIKKPGNVVRE
jgi:NitT/TauT family transport system substrate-binding protein